MFTCYFLVLTACLLPLNVQSVGQSGTQHKIYWFYDGVARYHPALVNYETNLRSFFGSGSQNREKDIHFLLYTRKNSKVSQELFIDEVNVLNESKYDKTLPTKIIIHGFTNSDAIGFPPMARQSYLENSKSPLVNLIIVDWGKLARAPWYNDAAKNTQMVGVKVARFIEFLVTQGSLLDQIHLIGHSLGSHVAAVAGSSLNYNNMSLSRITALDPALPLFGDANDEYRIDPTDAAFVDVIHTAGGESSRTNGGPRGRGGLEGTRALAFIEPRGHADFFPNGGRSQPGCGMDFFGACSHIRAYEYYLESVVNPTGFISCECDSWEEYQNGKCNCLGKANLGEQCSSSSKGTFFLRTGSKRPYALADKKG